MFLFGGSQALWSKEAVVVRMASFESSGRRTVAASTSETISLTGIVRGVGANFGPFSSSLARRIGLYVFQNDPPDTHKGFACLPYISGGLTEPLTRLLGKNEIRVVNKPFKTLQQEFLSPKFRQPSHLQSNVVYKIPCKDCPWNYIGETGRCFQTPKK